MRNRHVGLGIATVAAVLVGGLLAGCAKEPGNAVGAPAPSPSASPSASPSPVVADKPENVFGGDCSALLSDAEASSDIGVAVTANSALWPTSPLYAAALQLGGLVCGWSAGSAPHPALLTAIVLPLSAVDPARIYDDECTEGWGCSFTTVAGDFVLFGVIINTTAAIETVAASHAVVSARFMDAAASQAATKPFAPAGMWPANVDCAALDDGGVLAAAVDDPDGGVLWGGDAEPNAGFYAALIATGAVDCGWGAGAVTARAALLPGGAWIESAVAALPDATPVTIGGADGAVAVGDVLHVFTGVNWFTLTAEGVSLEALYPAASELVADLNALA